MHGKQHKSAAFCCAVFDHAVPLFRYLWLQFAFLFYFGPRANVRVRKMIQRVISVAYKGPYCYIYVPRCHSKEIVALAQ